MPGLFMPQLRGARLMSWSDAILAATVAVFLGGTGVSIAADSDEGGTNPAVQSTEARPASTSPSLPETGDYILGVGDHLRIRFYDRFDRDDLNGDYVVSETGHLRLPRLGSYLARGMTTAALERTIQQSVEKRGEKLGYFAIAISQCRPFYVSGLANRPGAYPFVPGLTLVEAVSLAGGVYRSPMASVADAMRENISLTESLERLGELMARQARLKAERDNLETLAVPKDLVQLQPLKAGEMIDKERNILQRFREVQSRKKSGYEKVIALTRREADSYREEISRIEKRLVEQTAIFDQLKTLRDQKLVNQQRFFEFVSSLDTTQRDKLTAIAGLANANTRLEEANKELSLLVLANDERIARESSETDQEIARLRVVSAQRKQLISGLDLLANQGEGAGEIVAYKIMRRDDAGRIISTDATETTAIMPGDVIQIAKHPATMPLLVN